MQQNDYTPGNQNTIACPQSETSVLQKQQRLIRQNISSIAYRVGIVLTSYLHYLYLFQYFATDCFFRCVKWNESFFSISQENIECSFESVATSPDPVVAVFDRAAQGVVSQFISWYTLHRVTFTS